MSKAAIDSHQEIINKLNDQVTCLTREIREYIDAENVMIAAGIVTKEKVEQAHEIVRKYP